LWQDVAITLFCEELKEDDKAVYLNCENFKRHSFPNVLIEILRALFREIDNNLSGWFGKSKRAKNIIKDSLKKLEEKNLRKCKIELT
jgi:hypothetical protein